MWARPSIFVFMLLFMSGCVGGRPGPTVTVTTPLAATQVVDRMIAATLEQRQPFKRTFDVDAWVAEGPSKEKVQEQYRYVQVFDPPDRLDETFLDLTAPGRRGAHTRSVGQLVYTETPSGWACARSPTPYRLRSSSLIFDPWVAQLRASGTRVSSAVSCAAGRCFTLQADFDDPDAGRPSLMHLEVVVDAASFVMLGYTAVRVSKDDGRESRSVASFEYGLRDQIVGPIAPCDASPPALVAPAGLHGI